MLQCRQSCVGLSLSRHAAIARKLSKVDWLCAGGLKSWWACSARGLESVQEGKLWWCKLLNGYSDDCCTGFLDINIDQIAQTTSMPKPTLYAF